MSTAKTEPDPAAPPTSAILPFRRVLSIPVRIGTGIESAIWTLTLDDGDGRGHVTLTGEDFAASYWWPRANRGGGRTLPAFLFGVGIDYFADKMQADKHFDSGATEKQAAEWLAEQLADAGDDVDPEDFDDDLRRPSFHTQRDWEEWCGRVERRGIYEAFYSGTVEIIRPDVRRLYEFAWPLLKARIPEIEAALYGEGSPS